MGFRIVRHTSSLLVPLDAAVTTRARLAADPRTSSLAPAWDAWIAEWKAVFLKEIDHRIAVLSANAVATHWDEELDQLSGETWAATAGDAAERSFYFHGKSNYQFTAPRLGPQYKAMGSWITHMTGSADPRIADIGARLAVAHKATGDAIGAAETAETASREFRTTGERRQLIDKYNALGKITEGTLKEMPHARPDLRLPNDFFERFMRAGKSVAPPTVEELTRRRDELKEQLGLAQAELDAALEAEKDAAAQAAQAQRAADEKKLAEAQAQLDAKNKEVAELRAKLGLSAEPEKP